MAEEALIFLSLIQKLELQQQSSVKHEKRQPQATDYGRRQVENIIEGERKVINELREIVNILRDVKLGDGRRLHYFISDLVEMAHDALDLYHPKKTYIFDNNEKESIQSWIREIKMRMLKLGDDVTGTESNMKISEYVGEGDHEDEDEDLVGMEEDEELLLRKKILHEEGNRSNLFLVTGMAGTGKTAFAGQLYNHASVIGRFERRAWVCVSSELTCKEVLMKLIQQVVDREQLQRDSLLNKMEFADNTSLQYMLRQCLQGVRYFIVLDDVPQQMRLNSILKSLPIKNAGSKLLITNRSGTRFMQVLKRSIIHEMKPLDLEQSWGLFLKTISYGNKSTSEHHFPKEMERMGRDMLSKCGGVPLEIKQMARQFVQKRRSGSEWEQLVQPTDFHEILEALILHIIVKIDNLEGQQKPKDLIDELRIIVDLVSDKKLVEESRLYYMICDIIDIVLAFQNNIFSPQLDIQGWTSEVKLRIRDPQTPVRLENIGDGDDENEDVVGLEEDVELLLHKAICNEEKRFSTTFITGMVGIGKKTLARQVYRHPDIIGQFDCRAWVTVSSDFSHKEVFIKLIQQVVDSDELQRDSLLEKMKHPGNFSLCRMLHKHLKGMRYFIVLADLPKEMCLQYMFKAFPHEDTGSRLLVTTSTSTMPTYIDMSFAYSHEMKPLDFDQSWRLFLKTFFCGNKTRSEHDFPKQMEKMGRDMLSKYGGVPFAIKQVARQLAQKRRCGSEWEQLLQPTDFHAVLEALILPIIVKIDNLEDWRKPKEVTDKLRMVVDLVRDKKLVEGSRLYYMICDIVDIALSSGNDIQKSFRGWTSLVKLRMNDPQTPVRLENIGDGDDENEDAVGLEEDVEHLLTKAICNEKKGFSTCLINGMVGIGKKTLARQVYRRVGIHGQFERRAWVRVSSDFSHKEVLIKLIQHIVDSDELQRDSLLEKMRHPGNFGLHQMLYKHLKGMRYFIVLADVPKEMCLQYMFMAFPKEENGCRLLLTSPSQNLEVTVDYTHHMKTLDSNKSWRLFMQTISELNFPKHLQSRGKELLKKSCDGLPLAIKHVGKEFVKKRQSGGEWEQLLESIDVSPILEILESSYHKLDQELKSCFLGLAFFKENTTFRREKLEQILAAGGIVSGRNDYEIRSYGEPLNKESMIEIVDRDVYGDTRTYRINAILHSLSKKKAQEEIDLEILSNNGNNQPSENSRHRVIICSREKFDYSMDHGNKHLVSLFFHGGGYLEASPSYWNSFEEIRILDLEDFGIKIIPESIGTLMELRYLGLRNNYIQKLPHSFGCLKKLKVLDIALNLMVEMPDIIWEMDSLLHLYMSDVICRMPLKIDGLKNLKTLTYIAFDNWTYELSSMQMMVDLQKLGIVELDGNSDVTKLFVSLAELYSLKHLILRGYRFRSMPCLDKLGILEHVVILKLDGLLPRLPSIFPRWMKSLTLVNSCLDDDPMPILEKLTSLNYLKLRNAYTGQQMVILPDSFLRLEYLFIEESWNLRYVQVGKGAMKNLKHLEIKNCPNLENLPEEIGSATVHVLTTKDIATEFRKSALISKLKMVEIKP